MYIFCDFAYPNQFSSDFYFFGLEALDNDFQTTYHSFLSLHEWAVGNLFPFQKDTSFHENSSFELKVKISLVLNLLGI